ncbi:HNH endonuclease signature motif containing protein [Kribbella pittospori]|uniref:HNH endonuclease signature motif containing protein n=1 Tax=Kribbella pittospori TaxID=722689 RepID=UPI001EDDBE34|nr:HNH endonuclease signature motif containing protein [Kribbella pittospori]
MELLGEQPIWSMSGSELLTTLDQLEADLDRRQTYRLQLIAALDNTGHAADLGAHDTVQLLAFRYRLDRPTAYRDVRLARALPKYPTVTTALTDPVVVGPDESDTDGDGDSALPTTESETAGEDNGGGVPETENETYGEADETSQDHSTAWLLRPAQAEAIVSALERVPTTVPVEDLQVAEQQLVNLARHLTPGELRKAGKQIRDLLDTDGPEPDEHKAYARESLALITADNGVKFRGYLANENAELLRALIHTGARPHKTLDGELDPRPREKRQADALTTALTLAATATDTTHTRSPNTTVAAAGNPSASSITEPGVAKPTADPIGTTLASPESTATATHSTATATHSTATATHGTATANATATHGTATALPLPGVGADLGATPPATATFAGATTGTGPFAGARTGSGPFAGATTGTGPSAGATTGTGPSAGATTGTGPSAGATTGSGPFAGATTGTGRGTNANGGIPGFGAKANITVTIDLEDLKAAAADATGHLVYGDNLSAAAIRRLACDANIIPLVLGSNSEPLDVGRSERLVTRAMRRALNTRDKGCVVCGAPPVQCDAHHLRSWIDGGQTAILEPRPALPPPPHRPPRRPLDHHDHQRQSPRHPPHLGRPTSSTSSSTSRTCLTTPIRQTARSRTSQPPARNPPRTTVRGRFARRPPASRTSARRTPVGRTAPRRTPVGRAALGRAAVGRAALRRAALRRTAVGRAAVGRAALRWAAVGRAAVGRAAVGRAAVGRAAVGRAALGRTPIRRVALGRAAV